MTERVLHVLAPERLVSSGDGTVSFTLTLDGDTYRSWDRRLRIEGLPDGYPSQREFRGGTVAMTLPGNHYGELLARIEISHGLYGTTLLGAFKLQVDRRSESALTINTAAHHVEGKHGVVYQPIDLGGFEVSEDVQVVGNRVRIPVPLLEEASGASVPLSNVLERERFLVVPDFRDGITRVLSVHVGPRLAIGRCFRSQLHAAARERLDAEGIDRVHWVTTWDDDRLHQVSAALQLRSTKHGDEIEVSSLTDYSRHGKAIRLLGEATEPEEAELGPGKKCSVQVNNESVLALVVGRGTAERMAAQLSYEELEYGGVLVPVIRTQDTVFTSPPDGGIGSLRVHYLGLWIPWKPRKLQRLLKGTGPAALSVIFPKDRVALSFRQADGGRHTALSASFDLQEALRG